MENNGTSKVYIIVALLLGVAGGYYLGSLRGYSSGYEVARVEIKTRLEETRVIEPVAKDVRIVSGTILSIGKGQFVLESKLPYDPTTPEGTQQKTVTRTVVVTDSTAINTRTTEANRAVPKAGEQFRPFITTNIKLDFSSLEVSDQVVVESGENISNKTSFKAVSIFKNGQ